MGCTPHTSSPNKDGKPTGWLSGDNRAISDLYNLLPAHARAEARRHARVLRALNPWHHRRDDPGATTSRYRTTSRLFQVWRERAHLRVRTA